MALSLAQLPDESAALKRIIADLHQDYETRPAEASEAHEAKLTQVSDAYEAQLAAILFGINAFGTGGTKSRCRCIARSRSLPGSASSSPQAARLSGGPVGQAHRWSRAGDLDPHVGFPWLFSATPGGADASVAIYGLIGTVKANDLKPSLYLSWLFHTLPDTDATDTDALRAQR